MCFCVLFQVPFLKRVIPKYLKESTISNTTLLKWKNALFFILFENYKICFRYPHISQYYCKSLSIDCNACGASATSAKSNKYNLTSSIEQMPSMLLFIFKRMSFTKNRNIRLELGSPCLTPMFHVKKVDFSDLYLTHAFTVLYVALI
jgi:hypothetical protein